MGNLYDYDSLIGFSLNPELTFYPQKKLAETKLPHDLKKCISGTSFDVAVAMQKMGKKVKVLGAVGKDDPLNYLIEHLLPQYKVEVDFLFVRKETALAVIRLDKGKREHLSFKRPIISVPKEEIGKAIFFSKPRLRIITGLSADSKEIEMASLFFKGASSGRVLNPGILLIKRRDLLRPLLKQVDLLIMNDVEAAVYFRKEREKVNFKDLEEFHELGVEKVIITCDVRGAMLSTANGEQIFQPKINAGKLIDETGAGDCFLGTFLACKLEGMSDKKAMKFAATAAALKVTKIGASSMPEREEVEKNFKRLP